MLKQEDEAIIHRFTWLTVSGFAVLTVLILAANIVTFVAYWTIYQEFPHQIIILAAATDAILLFLKVGILCAEFFLSFLPAISLLHRILTSQEHPTKDKEGP